MLEFLELEETVGRLWHRMVGRTASYARYPEAAVTLEQLRGSLGVFFRGLGGEAGVRLAAGAARPSDHRLSLRQRIGLGEERLDRAVREGGTLFLPTLLDVFPQTELNRRLYFWLGAFFAQPGWTQTALDPLQRDLAVLQAAHATTQAVLADYPGLRGYHADLCAATLAARPKRPLPPVEAAVEAVVLGLLGGAVPPGAYWPAVVACGSLDAFRAPLQYQAFLPVPLWGEALPGAASGQKRDADEVGGGNSEAGDGKVRKAIRRKEEEDNRTDPLILNRFEKILALAEMLNLNRASDDDDDEGAKKAADDVDELSVGKHDKKAATKLKLDLDLSPEQVDPTSIHAELSYPEWDYTIGAYRPDYCRVLVGTAAEHGETWMPDADTAQRIRRVRRQFEALRPRHVTLRAQVDGGELDLEAVVRSRCDLAASGIGSDRVHLMARKQARDLAVALLVDVSLSTDAWIENRRVLDVEKEALTVLAHGLAGCGDDAAIMTFTSRRRDWVRIDTVKDFDEPISPLVTRRIGALRPGFYTRIGTAVRHAAAQLLDRPNRHKLLILVTDGKPNDIDHYEGRYGIEDTRRAVLDARRQGVAVFGVTVDKEAKDYFPTLFGRGGYAIVNHIARLPAALPAIYRQLVA